MVALTSPRPARGFARWLRIDARFLPFADAASPDLHLGRLLRLSLFQVSAGMCLVLLTGTLNRVMIVELRLSAALVASLVALPLMFAPLRALLGFRSDQHRSALGWRRVPYLWFGSLLQFGGLAIMPFALILLSGDNRGPDWVGVAASALAFLLVGAGMHASQTAGLALATDLAPPATRPRVVALLYVMLLLGTLVSAVVISGLLRNFSPVRLIQVLQGAALLTLALNSIALWKMEPRRPRLHGVPATAADAVAPARAPPPGFRAAWHSFMRDVRPGRYLATLAAGTAAFAMQDVLLEPYGGVVLGMSVAATTGLTALLALGTLLACAIAARALRQQADPLRLAALGCTLGLVAFAFVIFAAPLQSIWVFRVGTVLIGVSSGLFALGMLTVAMSLPERGAPQAGIAIGAWGAVQATAAGGAVFLGGALQDAVGHLAESGALGATMNDVSTGYSVVYHLELGLLFVTLILLGPVLAWRRDLTSQRAAFCNNERGRTSEPGRPCESGPRPAALQPSGFGLAEFPG